MIEWYHWVIGGLIALSIISVILSMPSFIVMYKMGYKDYFRNIRILYTLYNKISICYLIETNWTQRYQYHDGTIKTHSGVKNNYYYPIYINDSKVFIIDRAGDGFWSILRINDATYDGVNWNTDLLEIKTVSCVFTQLLNDRFQKKLDKTLNKHIKLEDIDNLNELINSEIKSIRREFKINNILTNV
jgi:hypothetical protein